MLQSKTAALRVWPLGWDLMYDRDPDMLESVPCSTVDSRRTVGTTHLSITRRLVKSIY